MGVALHTLVVLVLLGCGFRSVEAVSFDKKHSLCNVECGQKGMWTMDQFGATAKGGTCYHCWATNPGQDCPTRIDYRDDGWWWDNCCNAYDCSCSVSSSEHCTQNQVGDGKCDSNCNSGRCGNDGGDCSASSPATSSSNSYCPCCYQPNPDTKLGQTTGARAEVGFCWHCFSTDSGGNCPDVEYRSDGGLWDDCCHKIARTERQVCSQTYSESQCIEKHGHNVDGFLDSTLKAGGAALDAVSDTVSNANPLSDLEAIEPDCVLKVGSCGASCTFGFKSAKSSLLVEFVLELDVQSASRGTATFEGSVNGKSLIKGNHDFGKGDTDAYCIPVPGLSLGVPDLGLSVCMDLDPDQTGGGFTITREVFVELFVRIGWLGLSSKTPLGNKRASWSCPNIPVIVGCVVGAVLLLGLSCFGYYRFRKAKAARLPSNPWGQASVAIPNVPGQGVATPVGDTQVEIVTGAVVISGLAAGQTSAYVPLQASAGKSY
jgi:hypothetical protein